MSLLNVSKIKHRNRKRWLTGAAICGLLGVSSVAYWQFSRSTTDDTTAKLAKQTVAATKMDITVQTRANGLVQAIRKTNVSSKESGRIIKLFVDEGVRVQRNQLLARMDDRELQAKVAQDKASLSKARAGLEQKQNGNRSQEVSKASLEVEKNRSAAAEALSQTKLANDQVKRKNFLYRQGAISRENLDKSLSEQQTAREKFRQASVALNAARQDLSLQRSGARPEEIAQAKAEVAQATAQLQISQLKMQDSLIRAPFAGVITRKFAQEGDSVSPATAASNSDGATSSSIVELSSGAEIEAKIPEASTDRIQVNQLVEIRSDVYPDRIFQGQVRLVAPRAIQDSQGSGGSSSGRGGSGVTSFRVRISLETGQNLLKLGTNVKLNFINNRIKDATVVPLAAVSTEKSGKTGVWLPDRSGNPHYQHVTVGEVSNDRIQIVKGLVPGQRIFLIPPANREIPGVDKPTGLF